MVGVDVLPNLFHSLLNKELRIHVFILHEYIYMFRAKFYRAIPKINGEVKIFTRLNT